MTDVKSILSVWKRWKAEKEREREMELFSLKCRYFYRLFLATCSESRKTLGLPSITQSKRVSWAVTRPVPPLGLSFSTCTHSVYTTLRIPNTSRLFSSSFVSPAEGKREAFGRQKSLSRTVQVASQPEISLKRTWKWTRCQRSMTSSFTSV